MKMIVKHIHTCHSHCCIDCRTQPLLLNQVLNASAQNRNCFHSPWNDSSIVVRVHWRQLDLVVPRHVALQCERSAPLDGAETVATLELVKPKRAYHQSSRELRNWVVDNALLRPTRTLRRWLEENKKEGREPLDACDVFIPVLREKCDPVGEAGVPMPASVVQPIFDRGRASWHDAQIRHTMDPSSKQHAPEAGHAILCRVRVSGRGGAGPAPQHHEASHGALGSAHVRRGGKTRALQRKLGATSHGHSWRHQGLRREPR